MSIPFVDLKTQYNFIKQDIDLAISEVINKTTFISGKHVKKFENNFSKLLKIKNTISCANGTEAIFIALKALNIGIGDEVITSSMSWFSTSEAISLTGAKVVFIDVDINNFNIDISKIEEKITNKTKAIIPVHLYGNPVNMLKINKIAKKYKLKIIEDCAQSHFAKFKKNFAGTFGDCGTFSFYPGKNLGAYGDAGAIVTNNNKLAKKIRMFVNHGSIKKHEHKFEGINSRMDAIQAAILNVKLKKINIWNKKRIQIAKLYTKLFLKNESIITPSIEKNHINVFHLYVIRSMNRNKLIKKLKENNIEYGIHYPKALPFLDAYKNLKYTKEDYPNAFKLQKEILSLPIYPELKKEQIFKIVKILNDIN